MYKLSVKDHIDAAHWVGDYPGKCRNEHGHRWYVEVTIQNQQLNDLNMVVDFGQVKQVLRQVTDKLDHQVINRVLNVRNATAEYLAKWFCDELKDTLKVTITGVTIWETPECCVEYHEDSV